ncbi:Uncharacterized protein TCAP_02280 [Tolypocladium capitatum]|uniref:Uncharacterized protein n=1 Tax=Tolypocladium capitatum TaxID=45235 RepID=A0A2K3QJS3_9HYPO|nr:Uncharacterized protein TCAP_02280 [Tolypocladium capitatum]
MKARGLLAALTALLSTGVDARNLGWLPKATQSVLLPLDGMTPKPTPPPGMHELVWRRDAASPLALTMVIAPDKTCGYVSGIASSAYTCAASSTCGLVLSKSVYPGYVVCFDAQVEVVDFHINCVDYNAFYKSSSCDPNCAHDTQTLKCTKTASKYCNTVSFPNNITGYSCAGTSNSAVNMAFTTFRGENDDRHYATIVYSGTPTMHLGIPSATGGGDGSTTKSKDRIGVIVGCTLGGVAAIGIVGIAIYFFLHKKKKKQRLREDTAGLLMKETSPMPPQDPSQNMMSSQQLEVHEAPTQTSENHRGQMYQLP